MNLPSGLLDEYKELRAVIRHYLDRRAKSLNFAVILTSALSGIYTEVRSPIPYLIGAGLIAFFWYDEIRRISTVYRLGTYIQAVIEPQVAGMNWETLGARHKIQTDAFGRILANGIFPLMFLTLCVFAFTLLKETTLIKAIFTGCESLLLLYLVLRSFVTSTKGRQGDLDNWLRIAANAETDKGA